MGKIIAAVAAAVLSAVLPAASASAQPTIDGPYSDHAVVQQDAPIVITGEASGPSVTVTLGAASIEAPVDAERRWRAELPAMEAGGPHVLTVSGVDGEARVEDVLVGDVWLCSGQSNMEFPVARSLPPPSGLADPPGAQMRLLTIPHAASVSPSAALPDGAAWTVATQESVRDFSAVCYFAARAWRGNDAETPIGLIDASWGGAQIEAFLPAERLRAAGGLEAELALLELYTHDPGAAMTGYGEPWEAWWRASYGSEPWADEDASLTWKDAPDEMRDWKTYDDPSARGHLGYAWYERSFTLSEAQAAQGGRFFLGMFDDVDAAWVNGAFLGSTHSWSDPRAYDVRPNQLRAGENRIVVNVLNTYGQGGMLGPKEDVALHIADEEVVPLGSGWRYAIVPETRSGGPYTPWGDVRGLTTIHNGMIAPLGEISLQAAIWYQGESNADHAETYRALLAELIGGWRERFGSNLSVLVVQLPDYGGMPDRPVDSGWSEVREAQRRVAVDDPQTGLVVTIDAGERSDIHPANKPVVGERAATVLRGLQGASDIFTDGVAPTRARQDRGVVVVEMETAGLKTISAARPIALELCDGNGDCAWADASLEGNRIALASDAVHTPAEVRYCWGDAPLCNLYTTDDLPISPFRIAVE